MNPLFMNLPGNNLILVADDNPFNRKFLSKVLKKQNFSVVEVTNGKEAIDSVKKNNFRLILMDMLMPGIGGFEATSTIRSMGISTPIIAISAMSFKEDQEKALNAGCDDFLPKPVDLRDLNVLLEKHILRLLDPKTIAQKKAASDNTLQTKKQSILFSEYSLLLVEEDQDISTSYCDILRKVGFNVTSVSDGALALNILKDSGKPPNIVISNLFTPEIDAMGLLSIIKREYPDIFMFIYTMQYDADTFQFAISQGVDGIIAKDSFQSSIFTMIETAIYQSQQKDSTQKNASTVRQVKKAQEQLINIGCGKPCNFFDVGLTPLHAAGGDMAKCVKFNQDGKCAIVLGDVAGHNVTSSYMSAIFMGLISSMEDKSNDPEGFMDELNVKLCKMGYETTHICATIILYDNKTRKILIATAGNPGGLLVKSNSDGTFSFKELKGGGLCMGLLEMQGMFIFEEKILEKESWLFHFSDGIEKEYIQEVLIANPDILEKNKLHGVSSSIISKIIANHGQEDDMILFTICTSPELLTDISSIHHNKLSDTINNETYDISVSNEKSQIKPDSDNHFKIQSTYKEIDRACKWLEKKLPIEKIPKGKDLDFIMLALREAMLNSVEHGNKRNPEAVINIDLHFEQNLFKVSIKDEGTGFDLSKRLKNLENYDGFQVGKRGLAIIQSTADSIEVNGGTISLTFSGV